MLQTYKRLAVSLIFPIFVLFYNISNVSAHILQISKNGTVILDVTDKIDDKLHDFIKSSIPFKCRVKVSIKEYSNFFFIKDKTLKEFTKHFKFNYNILKKQYTIFSNSKYFYTKNYRTFLNSIGKFKINNFIPLKSKKFNIKNCYIEIQMEFSPIKGGFKLSNIYILNNIKNFKITEKSDLEDIIGKRQN